MICHDQAADALAWLTNCPAEIQSEQPVPLAMVDCYQALQDWAAMEARLAEQQWGEFEFVRLAALSRA